MSYETKKDGGPAFPMASDISGHWSGMTLRDWFAGQALRARWGDGTAMTEIEAAQMAYQLADAMLAERSK